MLENNTKSCRKATRYRRKDRTVFQLSVSTLDIRCIVVSYPVQLAESCTRLFADVSSKDITCLDLLAFPNAFMSIGLIQLRLARLSCRAYVSCVAYIHGLQPNAGCSASSQIGGREAQLNACKGVLRSMLKLNESRYVSLW